MGTSLPHDALIRKMDELVSTGAITDDVIAQRGNGQFIPKHIKSFRFKKGLDEYQNRADIVVSNCGAGTIMENVTKGHRLVVIQNPDVTGGHEWELVTKMENGGHLIWCKTLESLEESIDKARKMTFKTFSPQRLDFGKLLESIT